MRIATSCLAFLLAACSSTGSGSSGTTGNGTSSTGSASTGGTGAAFAGFIFNGPVDAGPISGGANYQLDSADGGGTGQASVGSACASGADCASLGPGAACFRSGDGGFCTANCSSDGEAGTSCPAPSNCFIGLIPSNGALGRICLQSCTSDSDCAGAASLCSGSLFTFNAPDGGFQQRVCLPPCQTNADCNIDTSGLICDSAAHRCVNPADVLGGACQRDSDCLGLGPAGACMRNPRNASSGYCTIACAAGSGSCVSGARDFTSTSESSGVCASGIATTDAGAAVSVCLKSCSAESTCQVRSNNTCNRIESLDASACTIACATDADCPSGSCNAATGDCQLGGFFAAGCGADSQCPDGLCVADFHDISQHNCSKICAEDSDCPAGAICVTSPDAVNGRGDNLQTVLAKGFCAPACALDGGACADPTTACFPPTPQPEIDFAHSGSASGSFCWR